MAAANKVTYTRTSEVQKKQLESRGTSGGIVGHFNASNLVGIILAITSEETANASRLRQTMKIRCLRWGTP